MHSAGKYDKIYLVLRCSITAITFWATLIKRDCAFDDGCYALPDGTEENRNSSVASTHPALSQVQKPIANGIGGTNLKSKTEQNTLGFLLLYRNAMYKQIRNVYVLYTLFNVYSNFLTFNKIRKKSPTRLYISLCNAQSLVCATK